MTNKAIFVSYPRSGHHALVRILSEVTDLSNGLYCEGYNCKDEWQKQIECSEKRGSSNGFSCTSGRPFLKSHDFNLELPFLEDMKYVVQYRDPMLSIPSYYALQKRKSKNFTLTKQEFWDQKFEYWECFYKKWVLNDSDNILVVEYDEIGNFSKIEKVAGFLDLKLKAGDVKDNVFKPKRVEYDMDFFSGFDIDSIKKRILVISNNKSFS